MKSIIFIFIVAFCARLACFAQEVPQTTEQQLENLTDAEQNETEDDSYLQQLEHFRKHPLNLNEADANELTEFIFLTDLQIANLISYRNLLGKFISIYELQSIPAWDIGTIRKVLPYVAVSMAISSVEEFKNRLRAGDRGLMARYSEIVERSQGFDSTSGNKYLGNRAKVFVRYRYQYKSLLQYGVAADKDAGEQFLQGAQKYGFDFYSIHFFARKIRKIQALAIGDFTVNMGQGLIQWQSLALRKSADVMGIKRQSSILRPYNSSGEFYFFRGVGATVKLGDVEATAFASMRKLSANSVVDSINHEEFVSSFLTSGYHRTQSEINDRNNVRQFSVGSSVTYRRYNYHIGVNAVVHKFSLPVQKRNEPYNLYAISGDSWRNLSIDYSYTYRTFHFFGEAAVDKNLKSAFVNGLLISIDPRVDFSILQRTISKQYQAVYGNAFTENKYPTNEIGFYAGVTVRPFSGWRFEAYADFYKFPWLKYLVDAPGNGTDFLVQLTYSPNRQLDIYSRYRNESKQSNQSNNSTTNHLVLIPKQSWRTHWSFTIDRTITLRNRVELLWYDKKGGSSESGFLSFVDLICKPLFKRYSSVVRLQYFETDGYNSRIYAYENDVLYGYSIPAFFNKGCRYYINLNYDLKKNLSIWMRWAQTINHDKARPGSGLDEIAGNHRSEIKVEVIWLLK